MVTLVPAAAASPEQTTVPPAFTGPDFTHDLVIFVNTSREAYCDADQLFATGTSTFNGYVTEGPA